MPSQQVKADFDQQKLDHRFHLGEWLNEREKRQS
jgi:hypothetical protein